MPVSLRCAECPPERLYDHNHIYQVRGVWYCHVHVTAHLVELQDRPGEGR